MRFLAVPLSTLLFSAMKSVVSQPSWHLLVESRPRYTSFALLGFADMNDLLSFFLVRYLCLLSHPLTAILSRFCSSGSPIRRAFNVEVSRAAIRGFK